jgi:predicted AlkP superfamily phosphohydrolase/phosphomutase
MRSVVIGLPGCSWDLLERLLDTGELPNIARLRDESARGILESTIPFFSGPAWASFATGASPAAHGVYDLLLPLPDGQLQAAGQTALRRRTYFQQLGEEGKRSVVINFPLDHDGCEGGHRQQLGDRR